MLTKLLHQFLRVSPHPILKALATAQDLDFVDCCIKRAQFNISSIPEDHVVDILVDGLDFVPYGRGIDKITKLCVSRWDLGE